MAKTYRSDALGAVHETASDLHEAGVLSKRTLRKFDSMCLTPVRRMRPEEIRQLRLREHVSQAERGEKQPAGASLKLLTLVREKGLDAIA